MLREIKAAGTVSYAKVYDDEGSVVVLLSDEADVAAVVFTVDEAKELVVGLLDVVKKVEDAR